MCYLLNFTKDPSDAPFGFNLPLKFPYPNESGFMLGTYILLTLDFNFSVGNLSTLTLSSLLPTIQHCYCLLTQDDLI